MARFNYKRRSSNDDNRWTRQRMLYMGVPIAFVAISSSSVLTMSAVVSQNLSIASIIGNDGAPVPVPESKNTRSNFRGEGDGGIASAGAGAGASASAGATTTTTTTTIAMDYNREKPKTNAKPYLTLEELTQNPPVGSLECPPMTSPIYDRVVPQKNNPNKIPKVVHISFNSRCLGTELFADAVQRWKDALPDWSVYFHDDDAVDRLLQEEWPEFPHVHNVMRCIKYGGAMKSDLWRLLVIYRHGGLYSDVDNVPCAEFKNGTAIHPDDSFFSSSNANTWPNQNLFAMEPRHPIAAFAIQEVLKNLLDMPTLHKPKVFEVTGPVAFRNGYFRFVELTDPKLIASDKGYPVLKLRFFTGFLNKTLHKEPTNWNFLHPNTNLKVTFNGVEMSQKDREYSLIGKDHWTKYTDTMDKKLETMSCREYLYRLDNPSEDDLNVP